MAFLLILVLLHTTIKTLGSEISCSYESIKHNGGLSGVFECTGLSEDAALTYKEKLLEVIYSVDDVIETVEDMSLRIRNSSLNTVDAWISSPFTATNISDKINDINLEGCDITKISGDSLSKFQNLTTLNLNNNPKITSYEFFRNLTKLKHIYFSKNPNVNLDYFAKNLTGYGDIYREYVELADCSLSSFVISSDTNMYFVFIKTINLSYNDIKYVSNEYSLDKLKLILKGNSNLKSIGTGIFSVLDLSDYSNQFDLTILNNITVYDSLIIKNSNIKILDKTSFDINKILKPGATLDLANSSIRYIQNSFFENVNYKTLNLSFNNMFLGISSKAFQNSSIERLDLSESQISEINSDTFCNITTKVLKLSNNELRSLGNPFTNCGVSITFLDVSNNSLSKFEVNSLKNINGLVNLNLSLNPIDSFENNSFEASKDLKVLELTVPNGNNISSGVLQSESLTNLTFRNSNITYFNDGNFMGLFNLQELKIENSTIGDTANSSLNGLFNLKYLDKNMMKRVQNISRLPWYIFKDLHSITDLDLSKIYLVNIDDHSFEGLKNLRSLNLSNDFLSTIPQNTFKPLENLISLDLSYSYLLKPLPPNVFSYQKQLQYLSLRGNPTTDLITAGVFTNLENLIELDMSNNKWIGLDVEALMPLEKLKILRLDHNHLSLSLFPQFKYINLTEYLPNLEYIGISNNRWNCSLLADMLVHFTSRNIKYKPEVLSNGTNIDGIGCDE